MKAIHFKNERDGAHLKGLDVVQKEPLLYQTCCWVLSAEEERELSDGWVYLHTKKQNPSTIGGKILEIERCTGPKEEDVRRVTITFEPIKEAKNVPWRGADHGMAWSSGIVRADFDHERNE